MCVVIVGISPSPLLSLCVFSLLLVRSFLCGPKAAAAGNSGTLGDGKGKGMQRFRSNAVGATATHAPVSMRNNRTVHTGSNRMH